MWCEVVRKKDAENRNADTEWQRYRQRKVDFLSLLSTHPYMAHNGASIDGLKAKAGLSLFLNQFLEFSICFARCSWQGTNPLGFGFISWFCLMVIVPSRAQAEFICIALTNIPDGQPMHRIQPDGKWGSQDRDTRQSIRILEPKRRSFFENTVKENRAPRGR